MDLRVGQTDLDRHLRILEQPARPPPLRGSHAGRESFEPSEDPVVTGKTMTVGGDGAQAAQLSVFAHQIEPFR